MKATKHKSIGELVDRVCGKTFRKYYHEKRRHEEALRRIFARDKEHKCVPEDVGSVSQVHPKRRLLVTFQRCAICMRDMP